MKALFSALATGLGWLVWKLGDGIRHLEALLSHWLEARREKKFRALHKRPCGGCGLDAGYYRADAGGYVGFPGEYGTVWFSCSYCERDYHTVCDPDHITYRRHYYTHGGNTQSFDVEDQYTCSACQRGCL